MTAEMFTFAVYTLLVMKKALAGIVKLTAKAWTMVCRYTGGAWRWYKGLYRGAPWYKKLLVSVLSFIAFVLFYLFAVAVNLFWLFGKSPSIDSIMNPRNSEASLLYSEDSVLIGKYFNENRTPVKYEEINTTFFTTLIDTEDERFYSHHGIDFEGLGAAVKDMFVGRARGASTLTQQLVKNMFRVRTEYSTGLLGNIPGLKILIMKSKEWIVAVQIEMMYSKKEILTMYANTVDFGSNAYGIKTAAKTYFDTTPAALTTEQSAVLVGLLKATSTYNPKLNPKNSLRRRNVVLGNMQRHGHLTAEALDSLCEIPIKLNFSVETAYDGEALYFRQQVADHLRPWLKENGIDLYADGLKIYTTLNMQMQHYAEQAVMKQMRVVQRNFDSHWAGREPWEDDNHRTIPGFVEDIAKRTDTYARLAERFPDSPDSINYYLNLPHPVKVFDYDKGDTTLMLSTMDSIRHMLHFMHTGFVAIEPRTGHVKAWVGDVDYRFWKFDKAAASHQPGSTFKLFVYTEAMNRGLTPCDRRLDENISLPVKTRDGRDTVWRPHNAMGYSTYDSIPLRAAFARSINTIAVKLGLESGLDNVIRTAAAMGITSPLAPNPSLSLGSSDVNVLELVNAYATIADDGLHRAPVLVTKIVDRDGRVIYEAPTASTQAVPYRSAFLMQQMLMAGMRDGGGTSQSLWGYVGKHTATTDFGGKTGTTNNHADSWFVGVTPSLVAGAWVGGEYRSIRFRTGALGQGSRTALPIFGYFMDSILSDPKLAPRYRGKFAPPRDGITSDLYDCYYSPTPRDADTLSLMDSAAWMFDADAEEIHLDDDLSDPLETPSSRPTISMDALKGEAAKP